MLVKDGVSGTGSWSPDGRKIAVGHDDYLCGNCNDAERIWIIRATGRAGQSWSVGTPLLTSTTATPTGRRTGAGSLSPRNSTPAVKANAGYYAVEVVDLDSRGHPVGKWHDLGLGSDPSWSPDGTQIAFENGSRSQFYANDSHPQIYAMDANGKRRHRLTHDRKWNHAPAWSP